MVATATAWFCALVLAPQEQMQSSRTVAEPVDQTQAVVMKHAFINSFFVKPCLDIFAGESRAAIAFARQLNHTHNLPLKAFEGSTDNLLVFGCDIHTLVKAGVLCI